VTDIQLQEILDTRCPGRRDFLLQGLFALRPIVIRPSELPQLYDCGQEFDTGERFPRSMAVVTASMPLSFGNFVPLIANGLPANQKRPWNPLRDGFIAETALLNGMTLVTADERLSEAAAMFGLRVELVTG